MNLFRILGVVSLAVGATLLVFGIMATQKVGEKVVGGLTGHYTHATMWYIIGGIVLIVGGIGLMRVKK